MASRDELVKELAEDVQRRFRASVPLDQAPSGELNSYLAERVGAMIEKLPDPYQTLIADWEGEAHQLDLAWWESEPTPRQIVLGLAAAILERETREYLDLPR
ncbi:hypothetical protein [Geoalkalibacter subterraneus]|uniref:Uncharacterized protein n=1 Tax=Geoalkalibacter subterraneus TaxID=483547 RepID=A0A0B5FVR3_9BACT|nr:hypothetical protein [Geoalkalibacter subterraneus]AJF07671.1 hypothetical protein GSUB_15490 [Geoalkalibacter subterraneus]